MTIEKIIAKNGAWLDKRRTGDLRAARQHKEASLAIASQYRAFERIRSRLFKGSIIPSELNPTEACIIEALENAGLAGRTSNGAVRAMTADSRRFITGGWLEEISCLAALEAGADEALFGQQIKWKIDSYWGENEIDVIARFGDRLAFYSCKAYSASFRRSNDRNRKKLMEALHEADNLADHFGDDTTFVGLILSTDLYDEYAKKPKYESLFGKARALNVHLITLEHIKWDRLVSAMAVPSLIGDIETPPNM
ncbi:hypothetical protein [Cohaesibacter celericrescens]|uniref:hypothetical protein n=1 Tax=Cohaesibacter celericrescens TaxID=2067669 RepID=UPI003566B16E